MLTCIARDAILTEMRKPSTKKTAQATEAAVRFSANLRLNEDEHAAVAADIADMASHGATPPTVGAYAKHATMSYARLRHIEAGLRSVLEEYPDGIPNDICQELLVSR